MHFSAADGQETRRISFIDQIQLKVGPTKQIGRFFLDAERRLAEHGITVRQADFAELVDVHMTNKASWRALVECFDPRLRRVREEAACFIGYDGSGVAVTTIAVVREQLGGTTVRDVFEDLSFFFGENAATWRDRVTCRVTAPAAGRLSGDVFYPGAFWVHPSRRGEGFGYILPELGRFYALSQWPCDFEIGVASYALRRPEVQRYSHFQHHEESFILRSPDRVMYEGMFLWSTLDHVYARLERHVRDGLAADGLARKTG